MECKKVCEQLDDYFDNFLSSYDRKKVEIHLRNCEKCTSLYSREAAFRKMLKEVPSPVISKEFSANIFQSVYKKHKKQQSWANRLSIAGGAIAAIFVIFIYVGSQNHNHPQTNIDDSSRTTLQLKQTKKVKLLVNSPRDLKNAMITIMLPEQIALAGYPDKRQISWKANLAKGNNLLTIPLIGKKEGLVSVTTRIDHLNQSKELHFKMQINNVHETKSSNKTFHRV